jgi:hypothetical protein
MPGSLCAASLGGDAIIETTILPEITTDRPTGI